MDRTDLEGHLRNIRSEVVELLSNMLDAQDPDRPYDELMAEARGHSIVQQLDMLISSDPTLLPGRAL